MATSLDQIATFLENRGLRFRREDERSIILVPFRLEEIENLLVVVRLEENGEFLKIFTPKLFIYLDGPHKLPLMQTLLMTSWESKMLQWEYDPTDGELRAIIEFPIEDSILTEKQFFRAFEGLVNLVRIFHPRIRQVIESGADPGREDKGTPSDELTRAFLDFLRQRGGADGDGTGGGEPPDAL